MRRTLTQFLAVSLLSLGAAQAAGTPPPPSSDWSTETVVVNAPRHGPLFWHVSRGDAEVWILGTVGPMPKGLAWDHTQLEQILDGAKSVLLQPRAQIGFFEASWFLLTQRHTLELPNDAHLEDVLDPALKARFVAARTSLHRDADHYEDYLPAVAGFMLFGDFLSDAKLSMSEPQDTIKDLADHKDVPTHPIADYEAMPVVKEIGKMSDAASRRCLSAALDDIAAEEAHQALTAQAWAAGDLAGMRRNYSEATIFDCLQQAPSFAQLWAQSVADATKVVDAALAQGGKTLMVASLGALLRKDGILDRLRAEGATIDVPQ
ncbi:MAG TPA: TraB/GumN family protein [Rhizomicrobium sp.]|nr:TraB/GumN family protein [Rhizomicrobium sp.]